MSTAESPFCTRTLDSVGGILITQYALFDAVSEVSYRYPAEWTKYRGSRTVADMCYWLLSFAAERIFLPRDIMCKVVMQATSSLDSRPSC